MIFNFDVNDAWIDFLNKNAKWSVGTLIRFLTFILLIFLFFIILKLSGFKEYIGTSDDVTIKDIKTVELINESLPSKNTYKKDVDEINGMVDRLKDKLKLSDN